MSHSKESNSEQSDTEHSENTSSTIINSLSDLKQKTLDVFAQAKQKIQLYTHDLDPRILNTREIERLCVNFIRSSRYVHIEILITDERYLQGVDHRLVSLAQKYTSFMSIRVIPKDFHENHFGFYLIDGRKLIFRRLVERFEAEYHQPPSSRLKRQAKYFDEVWQQSSPAVHLRALNL